MYGHAFYATGLGVNYGAPSSRRCKTNIVAIDEPLQKISKLRGVTFDRDEEHGGHHDIGMIGEEVGAVVPEIVNYEENGIDAHGMDYSKLTPLLVEAVKALQSEQESQIAARDNRVTQLEEQNEALQARLQLLEQLVEQVAAACQASTESASRSLERSEGLHKQPLH